MISPERREAAPTGTAARLSILARVGAAILLCAAAVLLLVWLAERPGLRLRADLTAERENTLEPASRTVVERIPGAVDADVFFKPCEFPFQQVGYRAQERMLRLLALFSDTSGGAIRVRAHDLVSRDGLAAAQARMRELSLRDLEPGGAVVVSAGARKAVLPLRGEIADLDPGDPRGEAGPPRPARLVAFRGEEALVAALLRVSGGEAPKVVFTAGHGERDVASTDFAGGLSILAGELAGDGFAVERWGGEREGPLPEDCGILAILGPEQAFTASEQEAVLGFLESGGRVVCAPGAAGIEGEGSLQALLARAGIRLAARGILARPVATPTGELQYGIPQCADLVVWSEGMAAMNPMTEPLRRADRRVHLPFARSLDRGEPPPGGTLLQILRTGDEAWRDLPDAATPARQDWRPSPAEARGPFVVAMQAIFPPSRPVPPSRAGLARARPECRLLAVGSAEAFANTFADTNRDFLLAAFNWAGAREFRVNLKPRAAETRRLDISTGSALASVNLAAVILLPGACLALGILTAWRRRRR